MNLDFFSSQRRIVLPVLVLALGATVLACTRVRTETRRDMLGRPIVTTIKRGPGGEMQKTTTRSDQAAPIPGSIFGGGGTWYVNDQQVNPTPTRQPQQPIPFLPAEPSNESPSP